jgi:L-ascorbate metabolism protein UlaG (beta-lactamase superfamily)
MVCKMENKEILSDSIEDIMMMSLQKNELAFIYFGWAGIILRTKEKILAFDIGQKCLKKDQFNQIDNLDIQFYSHTHWDHFHLDVTMQLFHQTEAKIVAEPQVYDELIQKVDRESLFKGIPGKQLNIDNFTIDTVVGIHPRPISLFRVQWNGFSIFHGADSGYVSLNHIPAQLSFIPTGTPSPSCSPENGLKMALDTKSRFIVAMHGTKKQKEKFKTLVLRKLPDTQVIIPEEGKIIKLAI